ncbi:hypothetical protein GCM10011415_11880 [Salipiger pallidus]|uniref:Uncharacterized protein n=1 Tax=Salipiger pallidus TaxID=1775170 RepID=A0A8J3EGC5_9RHOB|nr:hypothetical protein GCM10011415_11880 [Salipiger pallidus]
MRALACRSHRNSTPRAILRRHVPRAWRCSGGLTTPEMRRIRRVFGEDLYEEAEAVPRDPKHAPFVGLLLDGWAFAAVPSMRVNVSAGMRMGCSRTKRTFHVNARLYTSVLLAAAP